MTPTETAALIARLDDPERLRALCDLRRIAEDAARPLEQAGGAS